MIEHQRIFWSGQYLAPDSGDPGIEPDSGHLEGEVTFTPVWDASVYGLLSDSQRSTYVKPFPFEVVDGELMSDDDGEMVPGVKVPASIGGHPVNWVARFNLSAGGDPITVRELRFASNPGGEVHLHNVIPSDAIYPQLPQDVIKGDSVTDIYTQGQYVVFIVGDPPRTRQHVLAFPGTDEAVTAAEAAAREMGNIRDAAQIQITQTRDDAEAHIGQVRNSAETHIGEVRDETLEGLNAAGARAEEARDLALGYRNQARTHATTATDKADDASTSAENAALSEANSAKHSRDAGFYHDLTLKVVEDFETDYLTVREGIDAVVSSWGDQFAQDLAQFQMIKSDMQAIATDVGIEVAKIDGIREDIDDALDVVRAHRWVPQGEWDAVIAYEAGDVVVHDGGSYYAQEDITAGVEPPGGQWVMLGQGGITDAAELTGVLTEDVDASDVTVHLEKYFPGLDSGPLADLIGNLILSAGSSVEASRITGALTDQVDVSQAMVTLHIGDQVFEIPIGQLLTDQSEWSAQTGQALQGLDANKADKTDPRFTDASVLTGALTDAVDASQAVVNAVDPETGTELGATITVAQAAGAAGLALTLLQGFTDALAERPTRDEVEARTPPIEVVDDLPDEPDPDKIYFVRGQ